MFTNRKLNLFLISILTVAATFVAISAIRVPARADLNWPPRPDFSILNQKAIAPFTGNQASSDYALRHPELSKGVEAMVDTSDYALRHPELFQSTGAIDTSDYYLRHR